MRNMVSLVAGGALLAISANLPAFAQDKKALIERGRYLANGAVACANCHTPRGPDFGLLQDKAYSGGFKIVEPAFEVYTANITPDKNTGIGAWTDAQIITAIREGRTREGKINFPPMPVPTYNSMSDADVKAIVAYLRTLKPIHNEVPQSKYNVPQQAMPPAKGKPAPSPKDKVAYGGYIVNSLAIAPGELLMPEGATNRTLDALARHGVKWTIIPFAAMQLNGGGIHCSTTPLIRDPV